MRPPWRVRSGPDPELSLSFSSMWVVRSTLPSFEIVQVVVPSACRTYSRSCGPRLTNMLPAGLPKPLASEKPRVRLNVLPASSRPLKIPLTVPVHR